MGSWETQVGWYPDRTDKQKTNILGNRIDKKTDRQVGRQRGMLGDTGGTDPRQSR